MPLQNLQTWGHGDELGKEPDTRKSWKLMSHIHEVQSSLHISGVENELPLPFPSASSKVPFPKCFVPQFTKKEAMGTRADADLVSIDFYWASGFS